MMDVPAEADLVDDIITAATTYQTPESAMIGTVLIGLFFAFIVAAKNSKKLYNNHLKKYGLSKQECPFGGDFLVSIIVSAAFGAFAGYLGSGILLGLAGQQDAPEFVYYFLAFLIGLVSGKYAYPFLGDLCDLVRDKLKISDGESAPADGQGASEATATETTKRE